MPSKRLPPCTGVILAGGLNIRFNREHKALANLGGDTIIDTILNTFHPLFERTIIVTNTPLLFTPWEGAIVTDIYPVRSPLTGIYSGLFYAQTPHIFVAACDTPFLKGEVVKRVLDNIEPAADVVIPVTGKGIEPLCAVYSKNCLLPIERMLLNHLAGEASQEIGGGRRLDQSLRIRNFFKKVRLKTIGEDQLRPLDPELISFFNVNTPEDLETAAGMLSGRPEDAKWT
jgi:molybdopterin-guanine dinucleotide biosynthesis protein A